MNIKKVGLTALAGSLIATSAFAGSMSVTGSAGISFSGASNYDKANQWSSGDSLNGFRKSPWAPVVTQT